MTMHPRSSDRPRSAARTLAGSCAALLVGLALSACAPEAPESVLSADSDGPGAVTVAWAAPTRDSAGNELEDLAGFRLYYSEASPLSRQQATRIDVGRDTTHTVEDLSPGTYHFAVSAVDTAGNESRLSSDLEVELP